MEAQGESRNKAQALLGRGLALLQTQRVRSAIARVGFANTRRRLGEVLPLDYRFLSPLQPLGPQCVGFSADATS